MSRLLEFVLGNEWALEEEYLTKGLEIIRRETDPEAVAREMGRPLQNTRSVRIRDGVAIIPVNGPLFRYANLFTAISGATSIEQLSEDIGTALSDPAVRALALDVDSPGGQVNGVSELAELIASARDEKPIVSFVSGLGASGGYWIASAASEIVAADTALLGSIGVRSALRRNSDDDREIQIISSQSPKKALDPEKDEDVAEVQAVVDELADVFIDSVADYRDVSRETVLSDFGRGGVLVGASAVAVGMADRVGTLEGVLQELSRRGSGRSSITMSASGGRQETKENKIMADKPEAPAAEQPDIDRAYLEANHGDLVAEFREEAATEERDRILGIQALDGPEDLVAECVEDPEMDVGAAAVKILEAKREQERARATAHLRVRTETEEGIEAPDPSISTEPDGDRARAKRLVALHHRLKGRGESVASA